MRWFSYIHDGFVCCWWLVILVLSPLPEDFQESYKTHIIKREHDPFNASGPRPKDSCDPSVTYETRGKLKLHTREVHGYLSVYESFTMPTFDLCFTDRQILTMAILQSFAKVHGVELGRCGKEEKVHHLLQKDE